MHYSVASISSPEFINVQPTDLNPLMSSCEIKVLYIGQNRNRTSISKETAIEMSKTLRGCPIVGAYKEPKQDFTTHGEKITIDDEGVHFSSETFPYGFVSPDAKVWFQKFMEEDIDGSSIEREYLMTTGYLWTGQYEEANLIVKDDGRPQSMELDEPSLKGQWTLDRKSNVDFFIINDATFSKLCILGEDVEPCFEGASIKSPEISTNFSNNNFSKTLFTMMTELKEILEGGTRMSENDTTLNFSENNQDKVNETVSNKTEINTENITIFEKKEESKEEDTKKEDSSKDSDEKEEKSDNDEKKKEEYSCNQDDDIKKKYELELENAERKYSVLDKEYNELKNNYTKLEQECYALREYKNEIENKQKDELIDKFYMLSEEDKKDVIENKSKYTLAEIESKLATIGFRNGVNFNLDASANKQEVITTFNLQSVDAADAAPDFIKAIRQTRNRNN